MKLVNDPTTSANVFDFKEEKTRRKVRKTEKDESYKPDFSNFQKFLNKDDTKK